MLFPHPPLSIMNPGYNGYKGGYIIIKTARFVSIFSERENWFLLTCFAVKKSLVKSLSLSVKYWSSPIPIYRAKWSSVPSFRLLFMQPCAQ